jgi:hypothetical protein
MRQASFKTHQVVTQLGLMTESPVYEGFYGAVRDVNASLPATRRLRVLLGDPPVAWTAVHSPADLAPWDRARDSDPADLVLREVVAKQP